MKLNKIIFIFVFLFSSFGLSEGNKSLTYDEILNLPTRPTAEQFLKTFAFRKNQIQLQKISAKDPFTGKKFEALARSIALLEYAFPNARYFALGRDAAIFGNALEFFFLSIGQKDRVGYIGLSSNAFTNLRAKQLVSILKSKGLDLDIEQQTRPFIIMDSTSFSEDSQSTKLVDAVYRAYKAEGGNPRELVRKVNVVSLRARADKLKEMEDRDVDLYFRRANRDANNYGELFEILFIATRVLSYGSAWHGAFSAPLYIGNGKYEERPGGLVPQGHREAILAQMLSVYKRVSNQGFIDRVQANAKELGYKFQINPAILPLQCGHFFRSN